MAIAMATDVSIRAKLKTMDNFEALILVD